LLEEEVCEDAIINPKDRSVVLEGFITKENRVIEVIKNPNVRTEKIAEPLEKQEYRIPAPNPGLDKLVMVESQNVSQKSSYKTTPDRMALIELLKREIAKKSAQVQKKEVMNTIASEALRKMS
ncbi:1853_t:CDS:2, partial [Acaulospora morrowiae]